ncbi:hypothetical protein ISG33_01795 [Glaciecola sp. MH2013]|uniref:hypothetical protein n=1 Tax=Glaciecola sp. MH2013 TaxID=2785524 RepID=UPI0018A11639|nr:hypothetical protein [Glaciecola sp. MH2013]MBF7072133.1 hypothetical protein [Glaciecola sp. MH2013]
MSRLGQYAVILLCFVIAFLANRELQADDFERGNVESETAESSNIQAEHFAKSGIENQKTNNVLSTSENRNVTAYQELSGNQELSVNQDLSVKQVNKQARNDIDLDDYDWHEEEELIDAKLKELSRSYSQLNRRYQSALARLEAPAALTTKPNKPLRGTAFESVSKKLPPKAAAAYQSFYESSDDAQSYFDLKTRISDYFLLHQYAEFVNLHRIDCKNSVCFLYVYNNDVKFAWEVVKSISEASDIHAITVGNYHLFPIDKTQHADSDYQYGVFVSISAPLRR